MKLTQLIAFIFLANVSFGQSNNKGVVELNWDDTITSLDTANYYIIQIDTLRFKQMLLADTNTVIQFWQPWCGAAKDFMPKMSNLYASISKRKIKFLIISDSEFKGQYFSIIETKIGIVSFYFNKYNIRIPTYIISDGESLDDYKRILSGFLDKKLNDNYFCFHYKEKKLLYQNYTSSFYKKYSRK